MVDRSAPTIPAPPASEPTTDIAAAPSSSRVLPLRPGLQILIGRPVRADGGWQCTGKLMGRPGALPRLDQDEDEDDTPNVWGEERSTETLLLRVGSGATAEEAERDLVRQLKHIAGATLPPPPLTITLVTHVPGSPRTRRRFSPR